MHSGCPEVKDTDTDDWECEDFSGAIIGNNFEDDDGTSEEEVRQDEEEFDFKEERDF